MKTIGEKLYNMCYELFPVPRSITGNGLRLSFKILQKYAPSIKTYEAPSGLECFDWRIPDEWNVNEAYCIDPNGKVLANFHDNNLSLVGYSRSFEGKLRLQDLEKHLYSDPDNPKAVPYVTSYYEDNWGFCLSHEEKIKLPKHGLYKVKVDTLLHKGSMTYSETVIKGHSKNEILLTSYLCHPSMANNELSGPTVLAEIINYIQKIPNRKCTYRILIMPETIGCLHYLSKNLKKLKSNVIAGYVVTCIGDNGQYSYLASRNGNTYADRVALHAVKSLCNKPKIYSFLERGSDERIYCSPKVNLPVCSVMRTKYHEYREYHSSDDNMNFISPEGLQGGFEYVKCIIDIHERNAIYETCHVGEPFLGKRGLYPNLSTSKSFRNVSDRMNLLSYANGKDDLLKVCELINRPFSVLVNEADLLEKHKLLRKVE